MLVRNLYIALTYVKACTFIEGPKNAKDLVKCAHNCSLVCSAEGGGGGTTVRNSDSPCAKLHDFLFGGMPEGEMIQPPVNLSLRDRLSLDKGRRMHAFADTVMHSGMYGGDMCVCVCMNTCMRVAQAVYVLV